MGKFGLGFAVYKNMKNFKYLLIILLGLSQSAWAIPLSYGSRDGYTYDIAKERYTRVYEIPLVTKPHTQESSLKKIIFVPKLTREFKERYEQTFGYTDIQRNIAAPNQYAEQEYQPGVWVTPEEDQQKRQAFGNYMVKRLTEHHVDQYFKSNPSVRPIYELKERISNVDLQVRKGYRVHIRYSYSGNYLNFKIDNPYDVKSRVTLEMDPDKVGPSNINETRFYMGYNLTKELEISTDYTLRDGDLSLIGSQYLGNNVYATLTGVADTRKGGVEESAFQPIDQNELDGEKKILIGLTWTH
ncbi:MAG: hypothetical protein KDD40_00570 [Bdellovibrionales bacterium]|nr:hypothetical protein [Bdellovibrionales bacterium]